MVLTLTDVWPYLRGPAPETAEWYWWYGIRPFARWWPSVLVTVGVVGLVGWWLAAPNKRWVNGLALFGLIAGNVLLQGAVVYAERPFVLTELIERTLSNESGGYFQPAIEAEDHQAVLRDYPTFMRSAASEHARTHPPGISVIIWGLVAGFQAMPALADGMARVVWPLRCIDLWLLERPPAVAAALLAWSLLPVLLGALTLWPVYRLSRRLLSLQAARLAVALTAFLPALVTFSSNSVQLDVFVVITAVFLFHLALERQHPFWFLLSGLSLSLATFLSLGNAAILLFLGLYLFFYFFPNPQSQISNLQFTLCLFLFALGVASLWLVYWAGWGVPPWAIVQTGLQQHYELVTLHRHYSWWVAYNLLDVLLFAGLPVVAGFVGAVGTRSEERGARGGWVMALGVLVLVLDVSGSARGEVGRLWLFFMPLLAVAGAGFWAGRSSYWWQMGLVGLQAGLVLSIGLGWRLFVPVLVVAERPFMPTLSPERTLQTSFADTILLQGYSLQQSPAALDVTLFWTTTAPTTRPYTVFNHLVNKQGELVAQKDGWPVDGQWPPTCWQPGEQVVDPYHIEFPPDLPAGEYSLLVGWYDARDGTRLKTADGQEAVQLGAIIIEK